MLRVGGAHAASGPLAVAHCPYRDGRRCRNCPNCVRALWSVTGVSSKRPRVSCRRQPAAPPSRNTSPTGCPTAARPIREPRRGATCLTMTVVDNVTTSADSFFNTVGTYASTHSDGIVAVLLLCGVVLCFTGHTLLRPTVFMIGSLPTTIVICVFGLALLADHHSPKPSATGDDAASSATTAVEATAGPSVITRTLQVVVVLFGVTLGLLVGMVMVRLLCRVAIFLICAIYGAICTLLVYFILLQPASSHNALLVWYAAIVLAALISALLSVTYPEAAIILGTALDGAALAVYCAAHFLGHPPYIIATTGETDINGLKHNFPADRWWAASYAFLTILLALFGAFTQRRVNAAAKPSTLSQAAVAAAAAAASESSVHQGGSDQLPQTTDQFGQSLSTQDVSLYGGAVNSDVNNLPTYHPASGLVEGSSANGLVQRMNSSYGFPPQRYIAAGPNGVVAEDEQNQLVTVIEPPRSPGYQRIDQSTPLPVSAYGATDSQDMQYSVIQNLGADPLAPSVEPYKQGSSADVNGKGPL